jgi:dihydrofolate reductase
MRRIIAFDRVSADGYFAATDGGLDWVVPEEEIDSSATKNLDATDTILFGRRTYQQFEGFWPKAVQSPASVDPHGTRRLSPELLALGKWIDDANKVVFSRTLKEVTWKNSRLLREIDPREIEAMKKRPGKDMMIFGSGSVVSELTKHGLIDEYHFVVGPVLLGSGQQMIRGVPGPSRLDLLDAKTYRSGNVVLRYARAS